jgi:hypothetical protein
VIGPRQGVELLSIGLKDYKGIDLAAFDRLDGLFRFQQAFFQSPDFFR